MENRTDSAGKTVIIGDLGEKRFPLVRLRLNSAEKEFVKKAEIFAASTPHTESWKKIQESTVFRLRKEDAIAQELAIRMRPQFSRYLKIELSGRGNKPLPIGKVEATACIPLAIFDYNRGSEFRVMYGNAKSGTRIEKEVPQNNPTRVLTSQIALRTAEERKNVAPPPVAVKPARPEKVATKSNLPRIMGIGALLVGLLVLFSAMLKARSQKRTRSARMLRTKITYR
jgi:hypothetical protein